MGQPSDAALTVSFEDPGSLQAVTDWASRVPVNKVARWEVLLLRLPCSGMSLLPQCHGQKERGPGCSL